MVYLGFLLFAVEQVVNCKKYSDEEKAMSMSDSKK
jgi:hypothetical protein